MAGEGEPDLMVNQYLMVKPDGQAKHDGQVTHDGQATYDGQVIHDGQVIPDGQAIPDGPAGCTGDPGYWHTVDGQWPAPGQRLQRTVLCHFWGSPRHTVMRCGIQHTHGNIKLLKQIALYSSSSCA